MAAIDYTVCLHSEVFVTTQGGNFPQSMLGHRRYIFGGHSKTIRPDKRKLVLFLDNPNIGYAFISCLLYSFTIWYIILVTVFKKLTAFPAFYPSEIA